MIAFHPPSIKDPTEGVMTGHIYWKMWRIRQRPYDSLQNDIPILMVSSGGPEGKVLIHQGSIKHLVKLHYDSPEDAWKLFSDGIPKVELDK